MIFIWRLCSIVNTIVATAGYRVHSASRLTTAFSPACTHALSLVQYCVFKCLIPSREPRSPERWQVTGVWSSVSFHVFIPLVFQRVCFLVAVTSGVL